MRYNNITSMSHWPKKNKILPLKHSKSDLGYVTLNLSCHKRQPLSPQSGLYDALLKVRASFENFLECTVSHPIPKMRCQNLAFTQSPGSSTRSAVSPQKDMTSKVIVSG